MSVKLLTEHNLEFLSLKGGCKGLSEYTLVKMPHCWKSHVTAQFMFSPGYVLPICSTNSLSKPAMIDPPTGTRKFLSKLCIKASTLPTCWA